MLNQFLHLVDEVRLLEHRLVQVADRLHQAEPVSVSERAVLEFLLRNGATTVPDIARARNVTRQHVQVGINSLLDAGLVERIPNPAHARSHLMALTDAGRHTIESMQAREGELIAKLPLGVDGDDLAAAARILASVREALPFHDFPPEEEQR